MNWKNIIADIQSCGRLTQTEIAKKVGCGQATINGLANEKTAQPSYALGAALLDLHRKVNRKSKTKPSTTEPAAAGV